MDHRTALYDRYATLVSGRGAVFDAAEARRWARGYEYYLRGWLPADRRARILDVACGHGNLLAFFKDKGFAQLLGIDRSAEQLGLAAQVGVPVEEADALSFLASTERRFDLVTAIDVIEHLEKAEVLPFVAGLFRVLAPGGRLIVQTPNGASPWGNDVRYGDFTHEVCFTPRSLRNVLELQGFVDIENRELGPTPTNAKGIFRWAMWRQMTWAMRAWNLVETGGDAGGIYSRVFIASARRP